MLALCSSLEEETMSKYYRKRYRTRTNRILNDYNKTLVEIELSHGLVINRERSIATDISPVRRSHVAPHDNVLMKDPSRTDVSTRKRH